MLAIRINGTTFDGFTEASIESSSGYSITVIPGTVATDNESYYYTFSPSSGTANVGGVSGGGGVSTAGPVSLID